MALVEAGDLPSLKRLQNLDADFSDPEERLQQAATIAGIDWQTGLPIRPGNARAEWVLKWTLEKIKSDGAAAEHARASPQTWILLLHLVNRIPKSNSARLLNAHQFLSSLKIALGERLKNAAKLATRYSSFELPETSSRSRKRKRTTNGDSSNAAANQTSSFHTPLETFYAQVLSFVRAIIDLSEPSPTSGDPISRQHLRAILRTEPELAGELLSLWIALTKSLVSTGLSSHADLEAFLLIWNSRAVQAGTNDGPGSNIFSIKCLPSAAVLYAELISGHFKTDLGARQKLVLAIEGLLLRQVILPARTTFFTTRRRKDLAHNFVVNAVLLLFKPLWDSLFNSDRECNTDSQDLTLEAIPLLFALAVQHSPRATPKQESVEAPWLECLFEVLANCAGESISEVVSTLAPPESSLKPVFPVLEEMLVLAKRNNVPIRPGLLEEIIERYSGLATSPSASVHWSIVAKVLDLDGSSFIGGRGTGAKSGKEATGALIHQISAMKWTKLPSRLTEPLGYADDRNAFVAGIVIPLLRTFTKSRKLQDFLMLWFTELKKQTNEITGPDKDSIAWTSDAIVQAISASLEDILRTGQILEAIQEFLMPVETFLKAVEAANGPSNFQQLQSGIDVSAAFIIIDAIAAGIEREETVNQARDTFERIHNHLKILLILKRPANCRIEARLWRLFSRILLLRERAENTEAYFNIAQDLLQQCIINKIVDNFLEGEAQHLGFDVTYRVCEFLLQLSVSLLEYTDSHDAAQYLIRQTILLLLQSHRHTDSDSNPLESVQMVNPDKLRAQLLALASLPESLVALESQSRLAYFKEIITSAAEFHNTSAMAYMKRNSPNGSTLQYLEGLQDSVIRLGAVGVKNDWVSTLAQVLDHKSNAPDPSRFVVLHIVEELLLRIPADIILRETRTRILDSLVSYALQYSKLDGNINFLSRLAGIHKLALTNNPNAQLMKEPATLWSLANCFKSVETSTEELSDGLGLFRAAAHCVFRELKEEPTLKRTKHYISGFEQQASKFFNRGDSELVLKDNYGCRALLETWFESGLHSEEIPREHLTDWQETLTKLIRNTGVALRVVSSNLPAGSSSKCKVLGHMASMEETFSQLSAEEALESIGRELAGDGSLQQNFGHSLARYPQAMKSGSHILHAFGQWVSPKTQVKTALIGAIERLHVGPGTSKGLLRLRLELIRNLRYIDLSDPELVTSLKSILPKLSIELETAEGVATFGYAIIAIKTILQTKPFLVSQYGIESVITALIKLSSPQSPNLPTVHAPKVYVNLCQITGLILSLHRKHIGGRYHLLIPLLQNLLTALFIPHSSTNKSPLTQYQPPWLSTYDPEATLTGIHATAYTRILTTLVQPTVASASSFRRHMSLTDETREARRYASRFVPYILMHYVSLQLIGKMDPDVRAALIPGIWPMIELVGRDGLRGMNAGLGRDERAVWEGVWAEWVKARAGMGGGMDMGRRARLEMF